MFDHYIKIINDYMLHHPHLCDLLAYFIALAESLPLIGTLIPGSIAMTLIGILAGRNLVPISTTLTLAFLGAFTGDLIGFWCGHTFHTKIPNMWPFKKHPTWLNLGQAFFKKHGGKSVVIGRFVGPVRSTVPLIAGLLKMEWPRFIVAALPSAFLWAIAYLMPGVLIGAISLELPKGKTTEFVFISLAIIVFIWLVFWAIQRFFSFLAAVINREVDFLWNWLNRYHSSRSLIRFITNDANPLDHHQLTLLILGCFSLLLFFVVAINVALHTILLGFNLPLFHLLQSIRGHIANILFITMTSLGEKTFIIPAGLAMCALLAIFQHWRRATYLMLVIFTTAVCVWFFKHLIFSHRPTGFMIVEHDSSFPSGHTTLALTILGFLAYLSLEYITKAWHWLVYTIASILIFLVAFSRLYLGAHWLTDILGSITLGLAILFIAIMTYRRKQALPAKASQWFGLLAVCIVFPWIVYSTMAFKDQEYRYTPYLPTENIYFTQWQYNPTDYLPVFRLNRFGRPIQPFNVQIAGDISQIENELFNSGWKITYHHIDIATTFGRFESKNPEENMPLFPLLYRNKPPILVMIKHLPEETTIVELRLWQTGIHFIDKNAPLYIGSVDLHEQAGKLISLRKIYDITFTQEKGIDVLIRDLHNFHYHKIKVPTDKLPPKVKPLDWDGAVLIAYP